VLGLNAAPSVGKKLRPGFQIHSEGGELRFQVRKTPTRNKRGCDYVLLRLRDRGYARKEAISA
jgi:hypothetical protein